MIGLQKQRDRCNKYLTSVFAFPPLGVTLTVLWSIRSPLYVSVAWWKARTQGFRVRDELTQVWFLKDDRVSLRAFGPLTLNWKLCPRLQSQNGRRVREDMSHEPSSGFNCEFWLSSSFLHLGPWIICLPNLSASLWGHLLQVWTLLWLLQKRMKTTVKTATFFVFIFST